MVIIFQSVSYLLFLSGLSIYFQTWLINGSYSVNKQRVCQPTAIFYLCWAYIFVDNHELIIKRLSVIIDVLKLSLSHFSIWIDATLK